MCAILVSPSLPFDVPNPRPSAFRFRQTRTSVQACYLPLSWTAAYAKGDTTATPLSAYVDELARV